MKKLLILSLFFIIAGLLILPIVYLKKIFTLSVNGFILMEITLLILIPLLIVTFRDEKEIITFFLNFSITKIVIILFGIIIFIIAYTEIIILGYTYFLTLFFLFVSFFIALFGRGKQIAKIALAIVSVGGLISALYGFYSPSFGNDTWRDALISEQIIARESLSAVSIKSPAYLPLVPLLYTAMSFSLGTDPLWSSSIVGLAYLVLLPLLIYLLSTRLVGNYETSHYSGILVLAMPLILIWSVWFIPMAYALLIALMMLYLLLKRHDKRRFAIVAVASFALIFGHPVLAILFSVLVWLLMVLNFSLILGKPNKLLIILYVIILISIMMIAVEKTSLKISVVELWRGVTSFFTGQMWTHALVGGQRPTPWPTSIVLSYIPISVIVAFSFALLFISTIPRWLRALVLALLVSVAVAFFAEQAFPGLSVVRYIGYPATVLLSAILPLGLRKLARRGCFGFAATTALLVIVIIAFVLSGSLTPGNPLTGVPAFGVYGLVTYDEKVQIKVLNSLFTGKTYILTDWRTGVFLMYFNVQKNLDPKSLYYGVSIGNLTILTAGSYGYKISENELITKLQKSFVFVLRDNSLIMYEAFERNIVNNIKSYRKKLNIIYFSGDVTLFTGT